MKVAPASAFAYVQEWDDEFLALFPHRYDFIWADYSLPQAQVEWKTESRYPLSDRLMQQGGALYGVRFGAETTYGLLDIDAQSPYHPQHDPFAISRILAALQPLGLVAYLACTSSYSGGLHLYLPFSQPQSSWKLAIALTAQLENSGFKLHPGHLEVFPNPKRYSTNETPCLFNAHRLPLQVGSYLLDNEFQPIWSSQQQFVQQWKLAQHRNTIDSETLKPLLKQVRQRCAFVSHKANKFINDLNIEIAAGWTGFGQTNRLLGRIAMKAYIFHHVLAGGEPLEGQALVDEIVAIARSLPGYREWCRHQHEIEHRAAEWARCIENSRYFHYGDVSGQFRARTVESKLQEVVDHAPVWNQQQLEAARDRIRHAIAEMLETNTLPSLATARFHALLKYGIGGQTLYRHRDLWHPAHLVENPPHPPTSLAEEVDCPETASTSPNPASLFPQDGSNPLLSQASNNSETTDSPASGSNAQMRSPLSSQTAPNNSGIQFVQQILLTIKAQRVAQKGRLPALNPPNPEKQVHSTAKHQAKMQQFLDSGDPILIAEALTCLPGDNLEPHQI